MTGSSNQGVRFVGPLITNATVGSFGFPAGVINGTGQLLPAPNCNPNNTAANSPWSRVLQLNESLTHPSNCYVTLWQALGNGAPLTPGRGYQMWTSGGQTLTFSGTVNNGDVNFNNLPQTNLPPLNGANNVGTVDRGWHLVSNPYPSPIQLTGAQLTAMGFEAQIQRFSTTGGTAGTWVASNPLTTVTLAPGQGFQVRTASIATAANFQLTNAFRTANPATFFNNDEWCDYHLDIKVTGSNFEDFTSVYFIDGATGNFDISYDANKWLNHDRNNLFTVSTDNQNLTYNGQALLNDYREIPMHFEVKTNGNYNFDFSFVESFPAGSVVFLKDNKTNTTTNLREVSNYSFTSVTTDDANRFILIFYPQLSLTTQTADCNNSGKIIVEANGLDWTYNVEDENQAVVAQGTVSNSNQTEILLPTGSYLLNIQLNNSTYSDAIENIVIEGLTQSIANFVMSSNEILVGESISFESTSSNAVAVEWLFGDGFSAIEENPIHYYNNAGWYEVSLKAISDNGCESTKTDNVWVRNETLSIDEVKDTNKFSLYSNGKSIFVNIPEINKEGLQHLQLKIYRLDGSLLNVYDLNGKIGQQTIKTDLLQNVYLAVILSEKDLYLTAKIFID
jgi:hypothetical protein